MPNPRRRIISALLASLSLAAIFASSAQAATQLGDSCVATAPAGGTMIQTGLAPGAFTYSIPADGVITSWGSNFPATSGTFTGKLKVLHAGATLGTYTVTAESATQTFVSGTNNFPVQIAVKAGDVIALASASAVACSTTSASDTLGVAPETDPPVGSTVTLSGSSATSYHVALHATFEADADHDGFGDDSQDACPTSAAAQIPCPKVKLANRLLPPSTKSLELLVTSTASAPVTVNGSVKIKLPKAKRSTTILVGPLTKTVAPGDLASFKLKFPKKLVSGLKSFPSSKKFKLKLAITGKGVANTDTSVQSVTLRGTKK